MGEGGGQGVVWSVKSQEGVGGGGQGARYSMKGSAWCELNNNVQAQIQLGNADSGFFATY